MKNPGKAPDSPRLSGQGFSSPARKILLSLTVLIVIFAIAYFVSYFQKPARTVRLLRSASGQDSAEATGFNQNPSEVLPVLQSLLSTAGPPKYISFFDRLGTQAARDFWRAKKREDCTLAEQGFLLLQERGEPAIPFLTNLLSNSELRPHALRALAYIGPAGIREIEFRALHSKQPPQHAIMNDLSPALTNNAISNLVARFTGGDDPGLRRMAIANLRSAERDPGRRLELYTTALADDDENVRLDALDHLKYDLTAKTNLKQKWIPLTNDVSAEVRLRAHNLLNSQ